MKDNAEINKVQLLIRRFLFETKDAVTSPAKSHVWLVSFRETLMYQDLYKERPNKYALSLLEEAKRFNNKQSKNQRIRWAKTALAKEGIKKPTQKQICDKLAQMYGDADKKDAEIASREKEGSGYPPSGGGATRAPETMGADPEAHEVESASGSSETLQGQEQRPTDADTGTRPGCCEVEQPSASVNFDVAAGPDGGGECSPPAESPTVPRRPSSPEIPGPEEVYDFAHLQGLDDLLAREWYEMTSGRSWTTRDGEIIRNWKGILTRYVRARERKLRQTNE